MKKIAITIICLLSAFINLQAQEIVSGTRVSIKPPAGFVRAKTFTGYQKGEDAMISINELNGGSFYSNAANFTKGQFESKGIKVVEFKEMKINGYPAKLAKMQGDPSAMSISMVFGDSTFSVTIMGLYPTGDEKLGEEIMKSILSVNYSKDLKIDPFEAAFFTLDDSNTRLKFSQAAANLFIYTWGGAKENPEGKPLMLVIPLPNDNSSPKETSQSMLESLKNKGLTNVEYIQSKEVIINGYKAYDLLFKGIMGGNKSTILVQTIVSGDKQLIIQGLQNGDTFDPEIIRELSKTVKFKD